VLKLDLFVNKTKIEFLSFWELLTYYNKTQIIL